jgi:hypothetical protein
MMADPYPPELRESVRRSVRRSQRRLRRAAPTLAGHALGWMRGLAGGAEPAAYFLHPEAFPMLLLPWWLEEAMRGAPAVRFQEDLAYSTISGYYVVRMIDDMMDGERTPGARVLPVLMFFHAEFEQTYFRYFPHGHPFWDACNAATTASAEMASRDAGLSEVDRVLYLDISARKIAGARVPVAAVCHRYDRGDLIEPWFGLIDRLGRWHQMLNDIQGWRRDLEAGRATYFLSHGYREAGATGSVDEWVLGDGLPWGEAQLALWMDELLELAGGLGSPALVAYLEARSAAHRKEWRALDASLAVLRRLAATMR